MKFFDKDVISSIAVVFVLVVAQISILVLLYLASVVKATPIVIRIEINKE